MRSKCEGGGGLEEEGDASACRRSECEAGCGSLRVRTGGCGALLGLSKCEGCGEPAVDKVEDACGELGEGEAFGEVCAEEAGEEDVVPARGMWRTILSSRFESFERARASRDPPSPSEVAAPARGMWWMILSKREVSGEFGADEVDFIFSKCDGDRGVVGVVQERVRSAGWSPGVLRRDMRSQKESSLPSETRRIMASYACSVVAFRVPCIVLSVLAKLGSAGRSSVDSTRAVGSAQDSALRCGCLL